jgi:hypothetical protein
VSSQRAKGEILQDRPAFAELDEADRARVLMTFLGQAPSFAPTFHYVHPAADGRAGHYVFDTAAGMVYFLD